MGGYRVAGENRAGLAGGVIADRDNDIEMIRINLLYALGFLVADRDFHALHRFQNQVVNMAGRIGAGTEGPETLAPQMLEQGLSHLGSTAVTGANEQDMVGAGHNHHPSYMNNNTPTAGLSTDFIVEQYFLERMPLDGVSVPGLLWVGFLIMDKPPSLLMVTNTLVPGGAEAMLIQLARSLDRRRARPVVLCLGEAGPAAGALTNQAIPVHAGLLTHKYDVRVISRIGELVRRYEPACIMAVGSGGDRMFWATLVGRRRRIPVIVWAHIFPNAGYHAFEWSNRRLYRWVDTFIALGQRHQAALITHERIPAARIAVIRNGIDPAPFEKAEQRPAARQLLGLADERTVAVGIIANLRPDKRHDIFIEAAARTHAARLDTRFFIIGDGPQRPTIERMMAQADPRGEFIHMLGTRDDVPVLMQGLDIVCLTSGWHEVLSIAMLEAMAAGKAFVAPRIGSLDEALIDGQTGCFFDPPKAENLARVFIEWIDQPEQRRQLGEQARAKVRTEFTAEHMARAFEQLVLDLCGRATASI